MTIEWVAEFASAFAGGIELFHSAQRRYRIESLYDGRAAINIKSAMAAKRTPKRGARGSRTKRRGADKCKITASAGGPVRESMGAGMKNMKRGSHAPHKFSANGAARRNGATTAAMRLAAVVQSSHDAIAAKTLNGIITDWNRSAERIFGYKPKEIIGKSVLTLIPKDRQDEEQEILRKIRRGESLNHYETVRRGPQRSILLSR